MNYSPVIGLEIHVELKTKSKMFCQCAADYFGREPNTNTCPVCLGLPGALPVPNKQAVEWTILMGKALNCSINTESKFDRKHYFYPDLPKGYQISQYDEPIAINGSLKVKVKSEKLKVEENLFKIKRVHLEEDTGKLIHAGSDTLVDFNRSGVPLVEIVTEPNFDNADDVKAFLEELHTIIRYLGISDADMEKGTMRIEPNISVRQILNHKSEIPNKSEIQNSNDPKELPKYKVEVKNINSFNFVTKAIEYEVERHIELLEKGETPSQETRGFNEQKGVTYSQRTKEEAHDYRYFPEPDIPPMVLKKSDIDSIVIPELPSAKMEKYVKEYRLKERDALILTRNVQDMQFFEIILAEFKVQNAKLKIKIENKGQMLANLLINKKLPRTLSPSEFVKQAMEMAQPKETNLADLDASIIRIIEANTKVVEDYKSGKMNAVMFLVGQVMREMKGKADAKVVREVIDKKLRI